MTRHGAVLTGNVNPNGSQVTVCLFEYGPTSAMGDSVPCSYSPGAGIRPVPVEATLSGLTEGTPYYFELYAKNANGETLGGEQQFTTPPTAPHVSTNGPKDVRRTTATLEGIVNPNESEVTDCYFEYGTEPNSLTETVPCTGTPGSGDTGVTVTAELTGLSESSIYYFRLVASNSFGSTTGDRERLLTLPNQPRANTEPATAVGHTSAILRGLVNPRDALVEQCFFSWGETTSLGNTIPCEQSPGAGEEPVAVSAQLSGLRESTTYYYKVVAVNTFGEAEGDHSHLTTLPTVPHVTVHRAEEVSARSAVLRGSVDPEDTTLTECLFEYGTTPALGSVASCSTLPSGEQGVKVSAPVSGLAPETEYYYRLVAGNAFGSVFTVEERFTTYPLGLVPVIKKLAPKKGSSAGGTPVEIEGTNLADVVSVKFGETEAESISDDTTTSVTAVAPPGAGVVEVTVTTEDGGTSEHSSHDRYTYDGPIISSLNPNEGTAFGGTRVTIQGNGFTPGVGSTTFTFGKAQATGVECSSTTTCTAVTPAQHKAGTQKVTAVSAGRKSKPNPAATFTYTE